MQSGKLSERFKNINKKQEEEKKELTKIELLPQKDIEITPISEELDLKEKLLEKVNSNPYWIEFSIEKKREMIAGFLDNFEIENKNALCEKFLASVIGFGDLQNLIDNEKVEAVYVNGTNYVYIEVEGRTFNTELKLSKNSLQYIVNILPENNLSIFKTSIDGYSVCVVKSAISKSGVNIVIRKKKSYDINALLEAGMIKKDVLDFIVEQIENKKRIVFAGGVNSGKSTLLSALLKFCLSKKRCYIIEMSCDIDADSDCWVKFDASNENLEQLREIAVKSNPEYIVSDLNKVDEMASLSTIRANSIENAFTNLIESYSDLSEKFAKQKALSNFDYIVYLENFKVLSVAELKPARTMAQSFSTIL